MTFVPTARAPLVVFDTMRGAKVPLELLEPGRCGIYCCGPTVYDDAHIGHARAALMPDVLVRTLRARDIEVTYVRNVTDVDDKIIARAERERTTADAVAERYTARYHEDLAALGMLPPDVEPKVTEHIDDIVALCRTLEAKGLAYVRDGNLYFRVRAFPGYGALSRRNPDEMRSGARVEVDERKEDPLDFALWKAARPGEPVWDSPWGPGRPGWHIECSAMSMRYLGERFDVHAGGRDLVFPHHENEIAQSRGATCDTCFAQYWMHNGFVTFAGEKMSKSLGNFFTIREVIARYPGEAVRAFLLGVHYRSPVNFDVRVSCPSCGADLEPGAQERGTCTACGATFDPGALRAQIELPGVAEADERVAYVYRTLEGIERFFGGDVPPAEEGDVDPTVSGMRAAVDAALSDDLNTSAALAALSEPMALANRWLASGKGVPKKVRRATLARLFRDLRGQRPGDPKEGGISGLLGLFAADPGPYLRRRRDARAARMGLDVARIEQLLHERQAARAARDFEAADRLRDELRSMGVSVLDGPEGSDWTV
ncbi:MAG: cysteine--tRNA ligase [Deltaproteobacteria bacterium]|nr:MAG: cysteine--tRNA ligase [Deltaproteobacteria bacterium]